MPTLDVTAQARKIFDEVLNRGELDLADDLLTPDFLLHDASEPEVRGISSFKQFVETFRKAFPDLRFTVEEMVSQGSTVVTRFIVRGTQRGPWQGSAATGKEVAVTGITIGHHTADGKLRETFMNLDWLGLMQQLGLVPATLPAGAIAQQPQPQAQPQQPAQG